MEPSKISNQQDIGESPAVVAESPSNSPPKGSHPHQARNWLIAGGILAGVGVMVWQFWPDGTAPTGQQPPPALVKVQKLRPRLVQDSSVFLAALEAKEGVVLRPETAGQVTQVLVSSGTAVTKGQLVMQLSPEKSQAEVTAAQANIEALAAAKNNATVQLQIAQESKADAASELQLQKQEFNRIEELAQKGAVAKRELDQATRSRDAAQNALTTSEQQIKSAEANLAQANADFNQAQADASSADENLKDTKIVAPIAGIVGDIPIKLGAYVETGATLTTIVQNKTLELNLNIPIEQREQLKVGLPVELTQKNGKQPLAKGLINFVSPSVNNNSQSVLAKASFPNPKKALRDGQRVEAKVIWNKRQGFLVPTTAITRMGGKPFVFLADQARQQSGKVPPMVARQQPVELGKIQGNHYQVVSGLQGGDTVIVSGLQNVQDGASLALETGKPPTEKPQ